MDIAFVTLPGIGGSGEQHWQTHWERADTRFKRFKPTSWDAPDVSDWTAAVDRELGLAPQSVVLVAHSLACLLVAHWAQKTLARVAGAFLVSVPDPAATKFPAAAASFAAVPATALVFPALIVASTDDPYGTLDYARQRAGQWKAGIVEVGPLGHINGASGLGDWPQGRMLLEAFSSGLGMGR
ncbi:alpha/beta fold hydrolase [Bradyrhizobium sp.]|uniref:RBBP9/YdeN family alpha/beta hydrolase n=1 Tax=Bradyrhizobium sp. TaxID=376 RepID=UPI001DDBFD5B|nr:alpha/beta fold hydrolase [Bradyrhizobium sp.]MBI5322441.1 serine hydrolase family protein [Bradyrhizobium sp.]